MADGFKVDMTEVLKLAADLGTVSSTAGGFIRSAVEITARRVKDDAVSTVKGRKQLGHASTAIDYDIKGVSSLLGSQIDAEIGYSKSKPAGKLGNLIEYGAPGSTNMLAPTNDLQRALDGNQEDFVDGLSKALKDAEHGAGF